MNFAGSGDWEWYSCSRGFGLSGENGPSSFSKCGRIGIGFGKATDSTGYCRRDCLSTTTSLIYVRGCLTLRHHMYYGKAMCCMLPGCGWRIKIQIIVTLKRMYFIWIWLKNVSVHGRNVMWVTNWDRYAALELPIKPVKTVGANIFKWLWEKTRRHLEKSFPRIFILVTSHPTTIYLLLQSTYTRTDYGIHRIADECQTIAKTFYAIFFSVYYIQGLYRFMQYRNFPKLKRNKYQCCMDAW